MACDNYTVGAIFDVVARCNFNDSVNALSTFQFILTAGGPLTMAEVADDMGEVLDEILDNVIAVQNLLWEWRDYSVAELDGDCATGFLALPSVLPGVLTNDAVPAGVAALVSFPTGIKRVVFRKYWPGLDESVVNASGNLTAAAITDLVTASNPLLAPIEATNGFWQYGYVSPKTMQWEVPNNFKVSPVPAYQRRRRPRPT